MSPRCCERERERERGREREGERERERGREREGGREGGGETMKHTYVLSIAYIKFFEDDNCCEFCGPEYSCEIFSHRFRNLAKL